MRKLAEQSKTAATDINQLLHHIQNDTSAANTIMLQDQIEAAEEMNTSLDNIASISHEVATETTQTASSAGKQVNVINGMSIMSEQMKHVVEELESLVSRFRTEA